MNWDGSLTQVPEYLVEASFFWCHATLTPGKFGAFLVVERGDVPANNKLGVALPRLPPPSKPCPRAHLAARLRNSDRDCETPQGLRSVLGKFRRARIEAHDLGRETLEDECERLQVVVSPCPRQRSPAFVELSTEVLGGEAGYVCDAEAVLHLSLF